MRVTAQTKAQTKELILQAARRLFAENGYEGTRTRDIAQAAGIASGTLFNYFQTKEAIVACLASNAVGDSLLEIDSRGRGSSLEEDLFAVVAMGLRRLKPLRKHLPALLETALSPLAKAATEDAVSLRIAQLETVAKLAAKHGYAELSPSALQLYWTLYTGALAFWAGDKSPKQVDTLALLDDSINMFVGWIRADTRKQQRS